MKITGFLNRLQKSKKSLEQMTDELVNKMGFDRNEQHYGGIDTFDLEDDDLNTMREILMDFIEKGMKEEFINKFHLLLEVERSLTLREGE